MTKSCLTDEMVAQHPAGLKEIIVWDREVSGLGFKVSPKGRRVFFLYYRTLEGQQRRPNLGNAQSMTVDEARRLAREKLYQVATGLDPSLHKQERTVPAVRLTGSSLRRQVIKEQDHQCARCKLKTWQGHAIPLELEHKNGNRNDDSRENVEALCCNCHALTLTWRGRNRTVRVCPKRFKRTVMRSPTVAAALIELGLPNSRYWYERARRVL